MASVSDITDPRPRSCWIEVDLDGLEHNTKTMRKHLPEGAEMLAVVKAEAYGHGASVVTDHLSSLGINFFGVATLEEALKLREFGIDDSLLIMGHTTTFNAGEIVDADLTPMIYSYRMLLALEKAAAKRQTTADIHVKIDTGMGRLGLLPDAVEDYLDEIKNCEHVNLAGVATHFAAAGEDPEYTARQREEYLEVRELVLKRGFTPEYWHTNNSAALLSEELESESDNLVRPGISLYGYPPHDEVERPDLQPVMSVRTKLADYKELPPGRGISYSRTFVPDEHTHVGVIPLGYADGYPREYSNKAYVLQGGEKKPVRGQVCMDMTIVELAAEDDPEETVTLMGEDNGEQLWADQLAEWSETITYEVLSRFSRRLPRVYLEDEEVVAIKTERQVHWMKN